jgi:hypothetical protein
MTKLQPAFYFIGLFVVLGLVSFGGTLVSLWFKNKEKHDDAIVKGLSENTIAIARIEAKLDLYIQQTEKDLNGLGAKLRSLDL